jgi:hypothetical protein
MTEEGNTLIFTAVTLALVIVSWLKYRGLAYVLINYRWLFVVFFLMPLSVVYDLYFYLRNWIVFRLNSAPHKHDEKVEDVKRQVNYIFGFLHICMFLHHTIIHLLLKTINNASFPQLIIFNEASLLDQDEVLCMNTKLMKWLKSTVITLCFATLVVGICLVIAAKNLLF